MTDYQFVITERKENVGIITINRPEAMNALNQQVAEDVTNALMEMDADKFGAFFDKTNYAGAFKSKANAWTNGWTEFLD